ncbi:MAG: diguanylate cyclase [Thermoanaerobaculia bacterium]
MAEERRHADSLRAIDGLLGSQLQQPALDGRALANLAVAIATENLDASRGTLLLAQQEPLKPVLALGPELRAAPLDASSFDAALVDEAGREGLPAAAGGRMAAPILVHDGVRGVLYFERGQPFSTAEVELGRSVAARIAQLLHSAELVDELSRRTRNLELLEALGGCLSAGHLAPRHLNQTVDAALGATSSDEGVLGLLGSGGEVDELLARGLELEAAQRQAAELMGQLKNGGAIIETRDPMPTMVAPMTTQPELETTAESEPESVGFLLVRRRSDRPYDETDRTFFRALAHLVTGALERRDYYRRAAEDPVTGTGSRLALQLSLSQLQAGADRSGVPFSLIIIDVDNFKEINDRYGHVEGDRVLKSLAETLRHRLRDQDFLARYGGDEFVALLPSTDASGAAELADELRRRVRQETLLPEGAQLSVSMGVVTYPEHAAELGQLIDLGDRALYASKAAGRDCVTVAQA